MKVKVFVIYMNNKLNYFLGLEIDCMCVCVFVWYMCLLCVCKLNFHFCHHFDL